MINTNTTEGSTPPAAPAPQRSVLERAESFIAGFEGDPLQEGIDELLRDIRAELAREAVLGVAVQDGIDAVSAIVGSWEQGDLAKAVREADAWANRTLPLLEVVPGTTQTVVVECSGGVVQDVTIDGYARVLVLDYDNAEDDTGDLPRIPPDDNAASVATYEGDGPNAQARSIAAAVDAHDPT